MAFALAVTPELIAVGVVWALLIGLFGALMPAMHAVRLPVATALRTVR
jgi:putative ABC transport system permease protein